MDGIGFVFWNESVSKVETVYKHCIGNASGANGLMHVAGPLNPITVVEVFARIIKINQLTIEIQCPIVNEHSIYQNRCSPDKHL